VGAKHNATHTGQHQVHRPCTASTHVRPGDTACTSKPCRPVAQHEHLTQGYNERIVASPCTLTACETTSRVSRAFALFLTLRTRAWRTMRPNSMCSS
jgi:hypothetical protein